MEPLVAAEPVVAGAEPLLAVHPSNKIGATFVLVYPIQLISIDKNASLASSYVSYCEPALSLMVQAQPDIVTNNNFVVDDKVVLIKCGLICIQSTSVNSASVNSYTSGYQLVGWV